MKGGKLLVEPSDERGGAGCLHLAHGRAGRALIRHMSSMPCKCFSRLVSAPANLIPQHYFHPFHSEPIPPPVRAPHLAGASYSLPSARAGTPCVRRPTVPGVDCRRRSGVRQINRLIPSRLAITTFGCILSHPATNRRLAGDVPLELAHDVSQQQLSLAPHPRLDRSRNFIADPTSACELCRAPIKTFTIPGKWRGPIASPEPASSVCRVDP